MKKEKKRKIEKILKELKVAKKDILKLYEPPKRNCKQESDSNYKLHNECARNVAKNKYGDLIDHAIKDIESIKKISGVLRSTFEQTMKTPPECLELGGKRMEKYHDRFKKRAKKILKRTASL